MSSLNNCLNDDKIDGNRANFTIITTKLLVKYIKHMIMGCNDDDDGKEHSF